MEDICMRHLLLLVCASSLVSTSAFADNRRVRVENANGIKGACGSFQNDDWCLIVEGSGVEKRLSTFTQYGKKNVRARFLRTKPENCLAGVEYFYTLPRSPKYFGPPEFCPNNTLYSRESASE